MAQRRDRGRQCTPTLCADRASQAFPSEALSEPQLCTSPAPEYLRRSRASQWHSRGNAGNLGPSCP